MRVSATFTSKWVVGIAALLLTLIVAGTMQAAQVSAESQPEVRADSGLNFVLMPVVLLPADADDDFSNPGSGWPTGTLFDATFLYSNGEYVIINNAADIPGVATLGHSARDFELSIDARATGVGTGSYGLLFGADSLQPTAFEAVGISPFFMVTPGVPVWGYYGFNGTVITPFVQDQSTSLQPNAGSNNMKVIRIGDTLTIEFNGIEVYSGTHPSTVADGIVGFFSIGDNPGYGTAFDNYRLIER